MTKKEKRKWKKGVPYSVVNLDFTRQEVSET